ncbi:MAG: hypothetical protein ACRDO0_02250, partial [Nocardioidaceae bacterium]
MPADAAVPEHGGDIDPGALEALGMRRKPVGTDEVLGAPNEDRLELDDLTLHPPGNAHDLPDPPGTVVLGCQVHDNIDTASDGRYHEAA